MGLYEAMSALEKSRRKVQSCIIFGVGGMGLFAVGTFIGMFSKAGILFPIVGIVLFIYCMSKLKPYTEEYKRLYKQIFVEEPIRSNFENVFYDWKTGFGENVVRSYCLCDMGNRFSSEDYIRASYHGINFGISDVYVAQHTSTGKSSHTTIYFKGRMMIFDFPEKLVTSVRIYSKNFRYRAGGFFANRNSKVEMESVNFNKDFDVMTSNDHDAFYLLTPHFMEKLYQLERKHNSIAVHISGNKVIIGFNEPNNNAFDASSMTKELSYPEEMNKIQSDIDDIKDIIDTIRDLNRGNDYYSYV